MADAVKFVDRWLKKNITPKNLNSVFPRIDHIFDAMYLAADEAGLSRDEIVRKVPNLEARIYAAISAVSKKK